MKTAGNYRTQDGKAQIEWTLEHKENGLEFSASGEFDGSSGQCLDSIGKAYPDDATVQSMVNVWQRWHLNGMRAGTREQCAEIKRRRKLAEDHARTVENGERYFYDKEMTQSNWHSLCELFGHSSYYSWECAILKDAGLYEVPLPEGLQATGGFPEEVTSGKRGYRFGERWIFEPLPAEVLAEIESWPQGKAAPLHEYKAKQFLAEHGLRMRITLSDSKPAPWDGPSGHHYRVTITRERTRGARIVFDFFGSVADAEKGEDITPYDVLSCVSSDVHTPETFADYCREFGEEEDSIKAKQTFRRCDRFARRLRAFFTEGEIESMQEIR